MQALCSASASPVQLPPPRTYGDVVRQARDALRRFRQDQAAGAVAKPSPEQPYRLLLQLPPPVASSIPRGTPWREAPFALPDESDWPGGAQQKLRALRPLAEAVLEGYDPRFLGLLESPADGMGCWSAAGDSLTLVGPVYNATFQTFLKLCDGGFGARVQAPDHTLVVLNREWTRAADIGQPWQRQLKARAAALIDPGGGAEQWRHLYSARMLRTSRGRAHGLLVGAHAAGWRLYAADGEESSSVRECVLRSEQPISSAAALEALNQWQQAQ